MSMLCKRTYWLFCN